VTAEELCVIMQTFAVETMGSAQTEVQQAGACIDVRQRLCEAGLQAAAACLESPHPSRRFPHWLMVSPVPRSFLLEGSSRQCGRRPLSRRCLASNATQDSVRDARTNEGAAEKAPHAPAPQSSRWRSAAGAAAGGRSAAAPLAAPASARLAQTSTAPALHNRQKCKFGTHSATRAAFLAPHQRQHIAHKPR